MSRFTVAMLKPDLAANPYFVRTVLDRIASKRISIIAQKFIFWNRSESEDFYKQHHNRFFYNRLSEYTSSGPMIALLLSGNDSISEWRTLMGPTKTFRATHSHPNSLRAEFGLTDTRNSTHGSDSPEAVTDECLMLFGKSLDTLIKNSRGSCPSSFGDLAADSYWSEFYNKDSFCSEWFMGFESMENYIMPAIKHALRHKTPSSKRAVMVDIGCGVSAIGPHIAKAIKSMDVYCLDFSLEALLKLRGVLDGDKFSELTNCFLIRSDATKELPFDPDSVTAILDKGCIDSVIRQTDGEQKAVLVICKTLRLLHSSGVFVQVSEEPPDLRLDLFHDAASASQFDCDINCQEILSNVENGGRYFFYTIKKL